MNSASKKALDVFLVGLLFLACLAIFWEILIGGKYLYGSDFLLYFHPVKKFIRESVLLSHSLPFWNPYLLSGTPFVTNIQASMFYPLGFLFYLLPPELAYGYSTVIHIMLGGLFMYVFMRGASTSQGASLFSAFVFSFNGFFMGHLYAGHLTFVQTYIWIPLVFHFVRRFIDTCQARDAAAAGLVLGLQILGGFPQITFYTILASILFVSLCGFSLTKVDSGRQNLRLLVGIVAVLFIAFGLSAVQVFPTLEFTRMSTRAGGVSYAMATYDSLHPKELLAFLMPDILGSAVDSTYWRSKEVWHFWETCGYVGILPLFLTFVRVEEGAIRKLHRLFVIFALLALFLCLGKYNPFYPVIYRLPGFNSFRIPAQVIFLYVFGISALSGLGLDQILKFGCRLHKIFYVFLLGVGAILAIFMAGLYIYRYPFFFQLIRHFAESPLTHVNMSAMYARVSSTINRSTMFFSLSMFLILLITYGKIGKRLLAVLACAVVFVDIYLFSAQFVTTYEFQELRTKEDIVAQLSKSPVDGRVVTNSSLFQTNDGLELKFPSALGYDPLMLRRYARFVLSSQGLPMDDHVVNLHSIRDTKAEVLALLNIRQMVTEGKVEAVKNGLPYAQVLFDKAVMPSTEVLKFMKSEKFNPRKVVVLEGEQTSEDRIGHQGKSIASSCEILRYTNEEIVMRVSTERDGYLVLSEVFYPGWQAFVDGKQTDVLCGNYIFRAIPIKPGDHEVRLSFVSWPFRIGLLISLITLSVGVLLIWRFKSVHKVTPRT